MKSNIDSKLLLGLVVGAAVGAAIGYLAASDKKDQILEELSNVAGKVKEGFNTAVNAAVNKYKDSRADGNIEEAEVAG